MSSRIEQAAIEATDAEEISPERYAESIGSALIDAARISIMGALAMLPDAPMIVPPGDENVPCVQNCLDQAMQWLEAARVRTIELGYTKPTSIHAVEGGMIDSLPDPRL